jgi:hypothetical protein
MLVMLREVQIPLLSAMLLSGCAAKLARIIRVGSLDAGLGPTAMFPMRLRGPVAMAMCALECGLGLGLIATAGQVGRGAPAFSVRLGTGLLFLVATSALIELRASRPDVGCGCFGEFSQEPVGWRTLSRSALLALAALGTLGLGPVQPPQAKTTAALLLGVLAAELAVVASLSPELGEALVRLGYSEPCELRVIPVERSVTALRRSKQWRRHATLLTADMPVDTWRELCWRYVVFPGRYGDQEAGERAAEVVFAVFVRLRRPLIHAVLVDAVTGNPVQWPAAPKRVHWPSRLLRTVWLSLLVRLILLGWLIRELRLARSRPGPAPARAPGGQFRGDAFREARAGPPAELFGDPEDGAAETTGPRSAAFY